MDIEIKGTIVDNDEAWIYDLYGIECTSPALVAEKLGDAREKNEPIEVRVASGGGSLNAGIEIYTALKGCPNVHITVAWACSAASVILCAARSSISPAGYVMIHNVSGTFSGDHRALTQGAGILKTIDRTVAAAYVEKTGIAEEDFLKKMEKETYLTAAEAVELGLCDEILGEAAIAPGSMIPQGIAAADGSLLPCAVIERERQKLQAARLALLKLR